MKRSRGSLLAVLVVLTVGLAFIASADGWRRAREVAISSPEGGLLQVCRDGILFQAAAGERSPGEDPPTDPTSPSSPVFFDVYSPPPVVDPDTNEISGGTIVARGHVVLELQSEPVEIDGLLFDYVGTVKVRWSGGQLLQPGPEKVFVDVGGDRSQLLPPYDIENCRLFRSRHEHHLHHHR